MKVQQLLIKLNNTTRLLVFLVLLVVVMGLIMFFTQSSIMTRTGIGLSPSPIPSPIPQGFADLSFEKNPQGVAVVIDTHGKNISGVQLEISYNAVILSQVHVLPGTFFSDFTILKDSEDQSRIFYAVANKPAGTSQKGKGIIAIISYHAEQGTASDTTFSFLPNTKVSAIGTSPSVLLHMKNATLPL